MDAIHNIHCHSLFEMASQHLQTALHVRHPGGGIFIGYLNNVHGSPLKLTHVYKNFTKKNECIRTNDKPENGPISGLYT